MFGNPELKLSSSLPQGWFFFFTLWGFSTELKKTGAAQGLVREVCIEEKFYRVRRVRY